MTNAPQQPLEIQLAQYSCIGDDGTGLVVLEYRYMLCRATSAGARTYPGARRWALESGEAVRVIDRETFEIVATGELLALLQR